MDFKRPVFDYLLVKVAAACNLDCTYCYWFRDLSVYKQPKIMPDEIINLFLERLESHIDRHKLKSFTLLFHGGEPLLLSKRRFIPFLEEIKLIADRTGCPIQLSMTTNGTLIDNEWVTILSYFKISTTISIDGVQSTHDLRRVDLKGNGTFNETMRGLNLLLEANLKPGVLAVCDPSSSPDALYKFFVDELRLEHFDILMPDATNDDPAVPVSQYYNRMFDIWYGDRRKTRAEIRIFNSMIGNLFGKNSSTESIGYGPIQTCTIMPDGSLEALDVLRIRGNESNKSKIHLRTNTFQDVQSDQTWIDAFDNSINLPDKCNSCTYKMACGGGHLAHRWSKTNKFANPSAYCSDIKEIFGHIIEKIGFDIDLYETDNSQHTKLAAYVPDTIQPATEKKPSI